MKRATYWNVSIFVVVLNTSWVRSFAFKPTMQDILNTLYLEWNQGKFGSKFCADLRKYISVANRVPVEFSDDSGRKRLVGIGNFLVGNICVQKEEMYTR